MTISPPVATAMIAPLEVWSSWYSIPSPEMEEGTPSTPAALAAWLWWPPPGVASVFVEIAGRPASNRRWVLDKLCSWRQSNIETLCQANIGRDSSGLSWSG